MSIAKKRIKHSVKRNYLKRRIRESFRHNQPDLDAIDCIAVVFEGAEKLNPEELQAQLSQLWAKLKND